MNGPRNFRHTYCVPLSVFLIGSLSIALLLWVNRISERLHDDDVLIDAIMDVQIHTATYHLWLEEVLTGNVKIEMKDIVSQVDQGIRLVDAVLSGGETEKRVLHSPLESPEMRTRAEEIRSLLIELKRLGLQRHQETDASGSGSDLEHRFHSVFRESLSEARALENFLERDETENHTIAERIFRVVVAAWAFIIVLTMTGLLNRERQRERAEDELKKANMQLLTQTEELTRHREHLTELVESKTSELSEANRQLQVEASEREQAEVALRASETQLRMLSARLMTAQETERKNISRELHDELGHDLTIMKLRLRSVEKKLQDQADLRDVCVEIIGFIDQTIENVRRLSSDLSPSILEDLGLTAAIRWLVENFNRNFEGTMYLDLEDIDRLFTENGQIMIYRVLQEAVTNIGKHARAGKVSIVIKKTDAQVSFLIQDDGKGFSPLLSPARYPSGKGLGLAIMEERVRMLDGTLDIQSQEGHGTRISFSIPTQEGRQ